MSDLQKAPQVPWSLRLILIASLALLLVATLSEYHRSAAPSTALPPSTERLAKDQLVIPGTRVGPISLGLPVNSVTELLGQGQLRPQDEGMVHLYEELGLVLFSEDDRVLSVTVRSPAYRTRSGVGVGSDVAEVLNSLGRDYEKEGSQDHYVLHNFGEGWHVGIKDNKVTYIQITVKL